MKINKNSFLPYENYLRELASINRNNPTRAEAIIWQEVLCKGKTGYKFLRQKPLVNFVLDFYCAKLLLAIEIDSDSHAYQTEYDITRTDLLNDLEEIAFLEIKLHSFIFETTLSFL